MSALLRASLRQIPATRGVASRRFMSAEAEKGWHIPFNYYKSKPVFGLKVASYLIFGFSIPFVASVYQLRKSGGSA
ncbi:hypothetical protein BDY19DRAFT_990715 [Irpex rosettiformis]|uniref:Uncharacterized protein n=1 Tax=Irpex rosettiformis TaxID=378272 RepID=A0ACB8UD25_9APHY|nr:hypothetical protein BDY19DRAFT_990715 [Irpex rosettiformis]